MICSDSVTAKFDGKSYSFSNTGKQLIIATSIIFIVIKLMMMDTISKWMVHYQLTDAAFNIKIKILVDRHNISVFNLLTR